MSIRTDSSDAASVDPTKYVQPTGAKPSEADNKAGLQSKKITPLPAAHLGSKTTAVTGNVAATNPTFAASQGGKPPTSEPAVQAQRKSQEGSSTAGAAGSKGPSLPTRDLAAFREATTPEERRILRDAKLSTTPPAKSPAPSGATARAAGYPEQTSSTRDLAAFRAATTPEERRILRDAKLSHTQPPIPPGGLELNIESGTPKTPIMVVSEPSSPQNDESDAAEASPDVVADTAASASQTEAPERTKDDWVNDVIQFLKEDITISDKSRDPDSIRKYVCANELLKDENDDTTERIVKGVIDLIGATSTESAHPTSPADAAMPADTAGSTETTQETQTLPGDRATRFIAKATQKTQGNATKALEDAAKAMKVAKKAVKIANLNAENESRTLELLRYSNFNIDSEDPLYSKHHLPLQDAGRLRNHTLNALAQRLTEKNLSIAFYSYDIDKVTEKHPALTLDQFKNAYSNKNDPNHDEVQKYVAKLKEITLKDLKDTTYSKMSAEDQVQYSSIADKLKRLDDRGVFK